MATLVLTAVGTALGGPIGGALGAFAGQTIDQAIFGNASHEGPRLNDLAVTTSSYGQPIPRHFGTMRSAGTVIWATDLVETKETNSSGKGQPKTTSYSYTVSFAVALASRPIAGVGRIWADGNLLKGQAGDLKTPGLMRIYLGAGDEAPDPLMASALGPSCPGHRGTAYIVFEELQLGDFGNRIPALTFEIFGDEQEEVSLKALAPIANVLPGDDILVGLQGFSDTGGPLRSVLSAIDNALPIGAVVDVAGLNLSRPDQLPLAPVPMLPETLESSDDGVEPGVRSQRKRSDLSNPQPRSLRYYDPDRDYQISVQRAIGAPQGQREAMLELPAAMSAQAARALIAAAAAKSRWQSETLSQRIAQLDESLGPGSLVKIPDRPGIWRIGTWEWMERGVELQLVRLAPNAAAQLSADAGEISSPSDSVAAQTRLQAFELPWDGTGSPHDPSYHVAVSATSRHWSGAALSIEQADGYLPLDLYASDRSVIGTLVEPLASSPGLLLEGPAVCDVDLVADDLELRSTTVAGIASGANRLRIGDEVLQFSRAEQIASSRWRLSGLLRGRGGTEWAAMAGHEPGTNIALIDNTLLPLGQDVIAPDAFSRIAALGFGDGEHAVSQLDPTGASRLPLSPVHVNITPTSSGLRWNWMRRSRGQYRWQDSVDVPLIEEMENYLIGFGPINEPFVSWERTIPEFAATNSELSSLIASFGNHPLWVAQRGTFGLSKAVLLAESFS